MTKQTKGLVPIGIACQKEIPNDKEIYNMIDEVIYQTLGEKGLSSIIKPGDKVVIKVNLVGPSVGKRGEKGRGIITDARIVRYVAEKIREIVGYEGTADIKVVDGLFYDDKNPSLKSDPGSFYWARVERTGDNAVSEWDICYDLDGDGILDGTSLAKLVNLDSLKEDARTEYKIKVASGREVTVAMPKFLRKKEDAEGTEDYCDVLIGLPIFKNHAIMGITGAIKLHYGFRHYEARYGDSGRYGHDGTYYKEDIIIHQREHLTDFLCAEHLVRPYDFVIMDALTGNYTGPLGVGGGYNGGLTRTYYDAPANYIFSNAILASKDSVAIDVAATELAGYNPNSIETIAAGTANGLGTSDISMIDMKKLDKFSNHRILLYDKYHPSNQYPFVDGFGGAKILPYIKPTFRVIINKDPEVVNGFFKVGYKVTHDTRHMPILSRAELWVNRERVMYHIDGDLSEGEFKIKLDAMRVPSGSRAVYYIVVWDDRFNCEATFDGFFKIDY